ncbi:MAG TPA: SDR family oxidoreductase [Gemmatimonadaceae bacterium]|nr:SDR family oxidoreductase [Gemmatimonadaceae bacterium]
MPPSTGRLALLVTGATGLLGARVAELLLADPRVARLFLVARDPARLRLLQATFGGERAVAVAGDVTRDGLGIEPELRARLTREVTGVVHLAASTSFSQSLDVARAVNADGTRRLLDLGAAWARAGRWVQVSTAFVAGQRTGLVRESDVPTGPGWVNAYEQSKAEAELLVRTARRDWVIVRPSTVVCDDASGRVTQVNAVHRALRLYFGGLAALLPGADDSTLDVVTTEYVAGGVARLALAPDVEGRAFHLCAGAGAMPLDELLDATHAAFAAAPAWRRKGIVRPARADLDTYRRFERAVEDVGSERVRRAVRSLSHFVPQLALPKRFDTSNADAALGAAAPAVREFWPAMVATLTGAAAREAA